jgi:hypothetical protein
MRLYDIIFWMKWPPPVWVWALAGVVVVAAALMIFIR